MQKQTAALLITAFTVFLLALPVKGQNADRPNVLFILVDDLGRQDVSPYNPDTFYDTPNIQRLAETGMTFTDAYVSNPVCSPSRLSFMTGHYPSRYEATNFFCGRRKGRFRGAVLDCRMPAHLTTMGQAFQEAGYGTYFAGKWHLGPNEKYWPKQQGFDVNKGGYSAGAPYYGGDTGYYPPYKNPRLEDGPKGEYLPYRLAEETRTYIENHKDEPFFAYLSFYEVHNPKTAPDDLVKKYQKRRKKRGLDNKDEFGTIEQIWPGKGDTRKVRTVQGHPVYAAMVEATDRAIGRVLQKLEKAGIRDETIVVLTSDHGGLSTSEGHNTSNRPLRGGKGWIYEGGLRVPMIVSWPGVVEPGSVSRQPIMNTDFFPTLLQATGQSARPNDHIDGTSFLPVLNGASRDEFSRGEPLYWHYPHYGNQGGPPAGAIRIGPWKLVERYEDGTVELYNVRTDVSESKDLSDQMPDRVQKMRERLHQWYREVDARFLRRKGDGPDPWRPDYYDERPIARFSWTDGTLGDDENGEYKLNTVVNGSNNLNISDNRALLLPGNDDSGKRDYLAGDGPGATPAWTVSFWFRTPQVDQGEVQGLLSNNRGTDTNYSWEVVVHNGTLQLRSFDQGKPNPVLSNAGSNKPALKPNTWHQVVVRKTGSGDVGELYLGTTEGISKVGTMKNNPGGLQMFRVGINRASDAQYRAELANLAIFRSDSVSIEDLNKAGPFEND